MLQYLLDNYNWLLVGMSLTAVAVFVCLFFVDAGHGKFRVILPLMILSTTATAQQNTQAIKEYLPYGKFESWTVRDI